MHIVVIGSPLSNRSTTDERGPAHAICRGKCCTPAVPAFFARDSSSGFCAIVSTAVWAQLLHVNWQLHRRSVVVIADERRHLFLSLTPDGTSLSQRQLTEIYTGYTHAVRWVTSAAVYARHQRTCEGASDVCTTKTS